MSELKASLFVEYNKLREGIHVSDIIYCPRESVFRQIDPKTVTDKELNFFTSGRAIHDSIQTLAKYYPKYQVEKEIVFVPAENIHTSDLCDDKNLKILAHVDLYDTKTNIPIEAKSARKARLGILDKKTKTYSEEQPKPFNVTQLKIYMSLLDAEIGYLLYQLLMNFDSNPFELFEVIMTREDRISMLRWLTKEAVNLVRAMKEKSPELARHVAYDNDMNWKCGSCKYSIECTQMRNMDYIANKYSGQNGKSN